MFTPQSSIKHRLNYVFSICFAVSKLINCVECVIFYYDNPTCYPDDVFQYEKKQDASIHLKQLIFVQILK